MEESQVQFLHKIWIIHISLRIRFPRNLEVTAFLCRFRTAIFICDSTTAAVRIRIKPKTGPSTMEFDHGTNFYSMREADKLISSPEDRIYWWGLQDTTRFSTSKTWKNISFSPPSANVRQCAGPTHLHVRAFNFLHELKVLESMGTF
jgi:hypothetical protein